MPGKINMNKYYPKVNFRRFKLNRLIFLVSEQKKGNCEKRYLLRVSRFSKIKIFILHLIDAIGSFTEISWLYGQYSKNISFILPTFNFTKKNFRKLTP